MHGADGRVDPRRDQGARRLPGGNHQELTRRGELVDAKALATPELARFVTSDGATATGGHRRPGDRATDDSLVLAFLSSGLPFALPEGEKREHRLRSVLHLLY
jgi:hypothetical protein